MTGILELLADAAMALVPGTVAVAVEEVRAMRWLAVEPAAHVTIRTASRRASGPGNGRCGVDHGHARAQYGWPTGTRQPPIHESSTSKAGPDGRRRRSGLHRRRPVPRPRVPGTRVLRPLRPKRCARAAPHGRRPGALLDNAGQLFGYWLACAVERDRLVLPTSIDRIAVFGPTRSPAPRWAAPCSPARSRRSGCA